jgi:UPF0755 protein
MGGTNPTDSDQRAESEAARKGSRLFGRRPGLQSPSEALQPEAAPPPPAADPPPGRRSPFLSAFSGFLTFLLVVAAGVVVATALVQEKLAAPGPLQADKILVIAPHTEVPEILAQLEQEGIIDSPLLVNVALWVEGNRSNVKAGEYLFRQNASARDVIDTLVSGKQIMHSITIPEGLTTDQILDRLRDSDVLTGDIHETPKEGSLLPETYKVTRGMPRDALIRKMAKDQDDAITRIWSRRSPDIPLKSPYELVTLASIVEKETGKADERPRVAEVFLNRLAKRMRLQSDPTIVYGLVGGKGTLGRGILKSEVDQPTPYNTYVIDGLPPGPIANPGVAALEAVANPSRTKELYFVADGTGGHVFAETLDEHAKNVARWRQIEKDVREKTPSIDIDRAPSSALPTATGLPTISPLHGDQHGQSQTIAVPVFGALPTALGPSASALQALAGIASFASVAPDLTGQDPPASSGNSAVAKAATAKPAAAAQAVPTSASAFANFSMGPDLDQMGIAIQGVTTGPGGPSILDGPVDSAAADPVDPAVIALSPARRADERARAAKYGLSPGSDDLPPDAAAAIPPATANAPATAAAASAAGPTQSGRVGGGHVPIYDASEGTPLDPLLNKTWDLNSPKTVPPISGLPAIQ